MSAPHDRPTALELVEAVREWVARDVQSQTDGRLRYHARVAVNVLAMVERELAVGAEHAQRHAERLAELGVADDAELAAAIRSGALTSDEAELRAVLLAATLDKLAVANPTYADSDA
ncbi:MAG: DUF6285 domain-containing protein [Actinomycetota bacterium]